MGMAYSTPVAERQEKNLFANFERKILIERTTHRFEHNIKVDSKEIRENMSRVNVGGPRVQCSDLLNTGIYLTISENVGNFLNTCATISLLFSAELLLRS